jgi:sugar phosphate isomerase/epimerase
MRQIIAIASSSGYHGIELRFVENEDSLWKLPAFRDHELPALKRSLSDHGLVISCVDTSCRFHFPDARERARWIEEGKRMADLAAALGAPAIRIFGDTIQPGADRPSTRNWIADSAHTLAENIAPKRIEVWLETHGDFACSSETLSILKEAGSPQVGAIWDPANCFLQCHERPREGAALLGSSIRHVHIKDLLQNDAGWKLVLAGEGNFPLLEIRGALCRLGFRDFVSFEWEKKWHPEIPDADIALPHFARWFRETFPDE